METERLLAQLLCQYEHTPGALLPLLHAVQENLGYVPEVAVPAIARVLHLSAAEVRGVISFYHELRTEPGGRHSLQVCRAESCQATGGEALALYAQESLGIAFGETTADGSISLDAVYCLGNCACSPAVRIDDATFARVDARRLDELLAPLLEETP